MQKYPVNIRETLEKIVTVSASSTREALEKAKAAWRQGKIVLSPENFMSVEYDIFDGNLEDFNEGSLE